MATIQWRPEHPEVNPARSRPLKAKSLEAGDVVPQDQVSVQPQVGPAPKAEAKTRTPAPPDAPHFEATELVATPNQRVTVRSPQTLQMEAPSTPNLESPRLTSWAHVSHQTFFNPLAGIPDEKMGPLGDLLGLPPRGDLQGRKPAILEWAQNRQAFVRDYRAALEPNGADGAPKDTLQELRRLEQQWLTPEASVTPEMRTMLMEGFKSKGSFADVARVYEKSLEQDPDFNKYEIPRENYIVALNKTKQTVRSIQESQNFIDERLTQLNLNQQVHGSKSERYQAYRDSGLNGEIFAGLGRAYKDIYTAAQKEIAKGIDQAGVSPLMQELSGSSSEKWSAYGAMPLGEQATAQAAKELDTKMSELLKKPDSQGEMTAWLEAQTGVPMERWPSNPEEVRLAMAGADGLERAKLLSPMVGRPVEQWSSRQSALKDLSQAAVRPLVEKFVSGGMTSEQAVSDLAALTGGALKGPIAEGVLAHKLSEVRDNLSRQGGLDPALTSVLSASSGLNIGSNLLLASRKAMEISRDCYQDGFGIDFEYYPGVNAVYNNLFLGNHEEAERLAPMVLQSCKREGGRTSTDYWNLATQVELGLIMNNPGALLDSLPRTLENAKAGWELSTTVDSIERLSQQRKMSHSDTTLLDFVGEKLRDRMAVGFPPKDPNWNQGAFLDSIQRELEGMPGVSASRQAALDPERMQVTDKLLERSTRFNEVFNSKFVGGNVPFGGQVSDVPINRTDLRALRHVIAELGLNRISDFKEFNRVADQFVEGRFGLVDPETGKRVLEDLHSPEHEVMDRFSKERHELTEARTSGSSKTNLGVELLMGTGDCRHTAISKQALFDVWKRDHQTEHLLTRFAGYGPATEKGDLATYEREMAGVKEWDKLQLVTFTMTFETPIDLQKDAQGNPQKYQLIMDEQGRPVKAPEGKSLAVEDHTFNAVLRFDDDGLVLPFEEGGLVTEDVFYKDFYPLSGRALDPREIMNPEGFDLGQLGVATADGEHLPFRGVVTRFSGNRPKPIEGECGQSTFGGLATAFNSVDLLTQPRALTRHLVDMVSGT